MPRAALALHDDDADSPMFLRIARAVVRDIQRGRLGPGDALPGSRTLAASLGVHRNTVIAAYRELSAEGLVDASAARATYVSKELPDAKPKRFGAATGRSTSDKPGFPLGEAGPLWSPTSKVPKGVHALYGGIPDVRLVPRDALARAYRRALKHPTAGLLEYGDPRGDAALRRAVAAMLGALRAVTVTEDQLIITRGSQMALDLLARTLLRPGDAVAVEALGYRPAWRALSQPGVELVPIEVDRRGMIVEQLENLVQHRRLRAIYVTPHHHYPTTVVMSPGRRMALLALARAQQIAVIEDDYDHEFHYEGRPIMPLASADPAGVVLYVGTLSKMLAPGLRVGFVAAPRLVIERLAEARLFVDRQGDHVVERALAELFEEGEIERHGKRARRVYKARRDAMIAAISKHLGSTLRFEVPSGGMAIWAEVHGLSVEPWAARCEARGVWLQTAKRFTFDGRARPFLRLGFAGLDERSIDEAVGRMAAARREA